MSDKAPAPKKVTAAILRAKLDQVLYGELDNLTATTVTDEGQRVVYAAKERIALFEVLVKHLSKSEPEGGEWGKKLPQPGG